jgi:exosortase D (VPLPA-CTERM-specific)
MNAPLPSGFQRRQTRLLAGPASWTLPQGASTLAILAALVPLGLIFAPAVRDIYFNWSTFPEYSYGPLVPIIAGAMIARDLRAAAVPARADWLGVAIVAIGCVPALLAAVSPFIYPAELGLFAAIVGLFVALQGRYRALRAWPGLIYLIFAIPLPALLFGRLNIDLQMASSAFGVAIIRLFDVPVFRDGNLIDLGALKLQVAEACSGLRYLFPLASFAFLAAYLFRGPAWQRVALFLSALPITVAMNSLRIAATGLLAERFGIEAAQGFFHDFEGWLIFCGCLALLMLEMKGLSMLGRGERSLRRRLHLSWERPAGEMPARRGTLGPIAAIAAIGALALALCIALGSRGTGVPVRESFAAFPRHIGTYEAVSSDVDPAEISALALTDYVSLDYRPPEGAHADTDAVNLWIAYYASQKLGGSTHSPRFCIPGSGWTIDQLSTGTLQVLGPAGKRSIPVNRVLISKGEQRQLVYYWFQERGRSEADEYLVKLHILLDGIGLNRTDGALVRLVTPLGPGPDGTVAAERRLQALGGEIFPLLSRFIPD